MTRTHRDREADAFLDGVCGLSRDDQAARAARRLFRTWEELRLYLEACLGDGYTLERPSDRDIRYALEIAVTLRVSRRWRMHLAFIIGHLHGLRPSLRQMNDPTALEDYFRRKHSLLCEIAPRDLALVGHNITVEDNESIREVIDLLKAGVPAAYLGAMSSIEAWSRYNWNKDDIYEAWKLGITPEYLSATWEYSGHLARALWTKGVPLAYLTACRAAGLDAYETMRAHSAGLPVEYAVAVGGEDE